MASFTDEADWGADVDDNGTKYPNDGGDYCGDNGADVYRVANKFTISTLPATDTVSQVDVSIEVAAVTGATGSTWILGPYNGDGQSDPDADTGAQMYSRCDVSSDNYLTGLTDYRTTGVKTHTALGATANSDVETARDSGTIFSLAWRMTTEALTPDRCEFTEYPDATNPPKLTITHAAGGGGATGKSNPLYGPLGGCLQGAIG